MKKILPFLLVICLLSFVLGACTDTTSPSPSTSNPPVSTPTPPPTQTTTTPPPTQELVTITIPTYRSGEDGGAKLFLPQVERFNQQYAGKYHFTFYINCKI